MAEHAGENNVDFKATCDVWTKRIENSKAYITDQISGAKVDGTRSRKGGATRLPRSSASASAAWTPPRRCARAVATKPRSPRRTRPR
jgi:hypothetical protein